MSAKTFIGTTAMVLALAAVSLLIIACGDDNGATDSSTATPSAQISGSPTPVPTAAGPGACDQNTGLCTPDAQGNVSFPIGDSWYVAYKVGSILDVKINAKVGQPLTVNVRNTGLLGHNLHVSGPDGKFGDTFCTTGGNEPCTNPDTIRGGQTGVLVFRPDQAGTFNIRCDIHPSSMKGVIQVTQ